MKNMNIFRRIAIPTLLILMGVGAVYGARKIWNSLYQPAGAYNQTALPTVFAPMKHPPVVTLNWARTNSNQLKLNFKIAGLESVVTENDVEDTICNPYIITDPAVSLTFRHRDAQISGKSGGPIEITYEYDMNANSHKSLELNLDLTIGPCADYLNAQESNVTPSVIPPLIGNYHLRFQVPVQSQ